MLEEVKLLLNITDTSKDSLLTLLISQATDEVVLYTHNEDIDDLHTAIVRCAVYNFNRLGSEGVDGESYSGVNFNYSTDYPDSIMRMLKAKRKVVVL